MEACLNPATANSHISPAEEAEIARLNAQVCSKENGIKRHPNVFRQAAPDEAARSFGEQSSPRPMLRPAKPSGCLCRPVSSTAPSASGSGLFGAAAHQFATQPATGLRFGHVPKPPSAGLLGSTGNPSTERRFGKLGQHYSTDPPVSDGGLFDGATRQSDTQPAKSSLFGHAVKPASGRILAGT
ncbi:hypothetical protein DPSP01_007682 [Paraphaeosphaeria sporulosa]|uniref:Uncharacterized protein n=1 Tax=Paraphaeosphaeria sporulosa TaxID=1460663 RepID=A0A177CDG6_9PLEO|nr:uncharacterized protein CC84DRAFT_1165202 [Paraphaeosphaeria sporulosa]OAG04827.1 hypothetical protein CC84DRAFT_1165202 [Paraphaeosphaeria sporulosa]